MHLAASLGPKAPSKGLFRASGLMTHLSSLVPLAPGGCFCFLELFPRTRVSGGGVGGRCLLPDSKAKSFQVSGFILGRGLYTLILPFSAPVPGGLQARHQLELSRVGERPPPPQVKAEGGCARVRRFCLSGGWAALGAECSEHSELRLLSLPTGGRGCLDASSIPNCLPSPGEELDSHGLWAGRTVTSAHLPFLVVRTSSCWDGMLHFSGTLKCTCITVPCSFSGGLSGFCVAAAGGSGMALGNPDEVTPYFPQGGRAASAQMGAPLGIRRDRGG